MIVTPAFGLFYRFTSKKSKDIAEEQHALSPLLFKNLMESVFGYVDVKMTGTEQIFFQRHRRIQTKLMRIQTLSQVLKIAPTKIIESAMFLGIVLIIVYGVYRFDDRSSLVTLLSVFAVAAYRVLPSINRILIGVVSLNSYQYTLNMIERFSNYSEDDNNKALHKQIQFNETIEGKEIKFSYAPGKDSVLKGVNFSIKRGEVLGIIGKSGSGKSTLMNMILGFLKPTSGSVTVDGIPLEDEVMEAWRSKVGYVQQDVFLTDGTIRENVAFGQDASLIDDTKVRDALKRASLIEYVDQLPSGVNTMVGERGGNLSGGQRQRVGIARSLYYGAEVLCFDEATSALDNETEQEVTEAIHNLSQGSLTLIIIAHRVTTLKYCDRILEMENGFMSKSISYDELIRKTI
jgi:ABC-type bacteriocin/lantibiotic exporter with double-glycine peptidase domain